MKQYECFLTDILRILSGSFFFYTPCLSRWYRRSNVQGACVKKSRPFKFKLLICWINLTTLAYLNPRFAKTQGLVHIWEFLERYNC